MDASVLTAERAVAEYFQAIIEVGVDPKLAANWLITDLFRMMNANDLERDAIDGIPVSAANFAGLLTLVQEGIINQNTARKTVLPEMWSTGMDARAIVEAKSLAPNLRPDYHRVRSRSGAGQ